MKRAVVVGCNGQFGTVFAEKFVALGFAVSGIDRQLAAAVGSPLADYAPATLPDLGGAAVAMLGEADVVLFCIPESALLASLTDCVSLTRPDALIMDIVSVKSNVALAVDGLPRPGPGYLSIHPMFAPTRDFTGRTICVVDLRPSASGDAMKATIASWGCAVPAFTATTHDRVASLVQAMPQAALLSLGAALADSLVSVEDIWTLSTPIMRTLLAMIVRVAGNDRLTHWAIQTGSADAARARAALAGRIGVLDALVIDDAVEGFGASLDHIMEYLDPVVPRLRAIGSVIVAATVIEAPAAVLIPAIPPLSTAPASPDSRGSAHAP